MDMKSFVEPQRILELRNVLTDLMNDEMVSENEVDSIIAKPRGKIDSLKHPLVYISERQLENKKEQGKLLDLESLTKWMAKKVGLEYYHIDPLKVKASVVTQMMSFAFAKQHKILAVDVTNERVIVACSQPYMTGWVTNLEHVLNRPVERVFASAIDIERYTTEFYTLAKSILGASGDANLNARGGNIEALLELGELKDPEANDQHIVTVVDWLFQYAFEQRASDIHIEPRRKVGYVRFRIDGVLHRVYEMPAQVILAIISRIKNMGRLNIAEKRKPQDGRLKTKTPDGLEIELRLSTMPTAFGEKLVMRIFDPEVLLKSFNQLGLANQDYERWNKMTSRPNGIVLVTGPTGSGKTTTLYSTLKHLATPEVNVCSIEDPIEMVEDSFNQMQVHHGIDLTFAEGVKALLRQDPDIIMVGEIRDKETAEMAVQAALTGHLVLSTLHTNDAPSAITRLLEIGLPAYILKATLLGVMAQRLVRTLCSSCKQEGEVNVEMWNELVAPWQVDPPEKIYKPVGCLDCRGTGYKGRQGIYEVLEMSSKVQKYITNDCDLAAIRKEGMKEGMRTLRLSGAQKVAAGMTTIEEVMRVAPAPHNQ